MYIHIYTHTHTHRYTHKDKQTLSYTNKYICINREREIERKTSSHMDTSTYTHIQI